MVVVSLIGEGATEVLISQTVSSKFQPWGKSTDLIGKSQLLGAPVSSTAKMESILLLTSWGCHED